MRRTRNKRQATNNSDGRQHGETKTEDRRRRQGGAIEETTRPNSDEMILLQCRDRQPSRSPSYSLGSSSFTQANTHSTPPTEKSDTNRAHTHTHRYIPRNEAAHGHPRYTRSLLVIVGVDSPGVAARQCIRCAQVRRLLVVGRRRAEGCTCRCPCQPTRVAHRRNRRTEATTTGLAAVCSLCPRIDQVLLDAFVVAGDTVDVVVGVDRGSP